MKRFRLKVYREIFDAIKSDPTRYETIKNYADDINPILNRIASEYLSIKCCTTFFLGLICNISEDKAFEKYNNLFPGDMTQKDSLRRAMDRAKKGLAEKILADDEFNSIKDEIYKIHGWNYDK